MRIDFECGSCGECCRQEGYVFINPGEVQKLAGVLDVTEKIFLESYAEKFQNSLRMAGPYNEPCIFLQKGKCAVYEARPSQCRTFPFWGENFRLSGRLKELSSYCRGIKIKREVKEI